ncbi:MAG: serine hydrolase domain-containing protein [Cyclobacteriaceae bacterium]|nr:MAG: serine hydrolase domain-containing protein [Cyclobacteriaceae bacterium]
MKQLLLPVLIIFLLVECAPKEKTSTFSEEIDNLFSTEFNADEPGACVLIRKGDSTLFLKSYGLADLVTKESISPKTLFNLGSISKPFVAYGILMLRDEGKLSLDDPISKYFPDFKNKSMAESVTIRHLLTHTSGLPDIRKTREDSVFYLTAKDAENWVPIMQADSLEFNPGEQYEYSNPAFNALALIIEQVSEMKWQKFIEERIFKPAGMTTSTITDGPHPESGVSHGYVNVKGEWLEKDYGEEPTFAAAGNGGVWSSVDELVLYERAMRNAVFTSHETITESHQVVKPQNWKADYEPFIGLSWFIETTNAGDKIVAHTGTQGGFYCHYVSVPAKGILYVVLANRHYERESRYEQVFTILEKHGHLN